MDFSEIDALDEMTLSEMYNDAIFSEGNLISEGRTGSMNQGGYWNVGTGHCVGSLRCSITYNVTEHGFYYHCSRSARLYPRHIQDACGAAARTPGGALCYITTGILIGNTGWQGYFAPNSHVWYCNR